MKRTVNKKAIEKVLSSLALDDFNKTMPPDDVLLPMIIIMKSDKMVNK